MARSKTQETADAGEDVEKEENSFIAGGTVSWKSVWQFLRKFDILLPEDPAISLLGIYPKDAPMCNKDTCSTMFIEAIFIIARNWKQPRCLPTEEWIQHLWYICTME